MNVQLPDGTVIEGVPEGTTKADLAAKLKANGKAVPADWLAPSKPAPTLDELRKTQGWKQIAPIHTDYSSTPGDTAKSYGTAVGHALRSEAEGVMDPIVGVGQAVAHVLGQGDTADALVQRREANIAAERGGDTGIDTWRTVGNVMSPVNYLGPSGGANALARIGKAAATGATVNAMQPVTQGDYLSEKAQQIGVGAAAGGVLGGVAEGAGALIKAGSDAATKAMGKFLGKNIPTTPDSAAYQKVKEAWERDQKAGGPSFNQVAATLNAAHASGKPLTLMDLGGSDIKGMAGYLSRQGGEAGATINKFLDERDAGTAGRIHDDITKSISGGDSMKQTADALKETRKAAAKPLYDVAMAPGSTAPLQPQFEAEFGRIQTERAAAAKELNEAERRVEATAAKNAQAGKTGELEMRNRDANAEAQGKLAEAKQKMAQLDEVEAKTTAAMREAQRAAAAGERGGVWSPRLAQFLANPRIQKAIGTGLKIERDLSDAEGKPFNVRDFAATVDETGEPKIGLVPNMKLLDAAKKGLDNILEGYRDKTTGKLVLDGEGRAIDMLRGAFVDEIDRLNPAYKAARAAWAGPSQAMDAIQMGRDLLKRSPEEISAFMKGATPNQREFVRLGLADRLRQAVDEVRLSGDESKAIIKNQRNKDQIMAAFDDPKEAQKFIDNIMHERQMFDTANDIRGNSATARRLAADAQNSGDMEAAAHAMNAAKHAMGGNMLRSMSDMWKAKQALGWRKNQEMNAEVAKILTDPLAGSGAGAKLLASFPGPATRNYLQQGFLDAAMRAAPAAAILSNQSVQQ